ncbi:hypothetical protein, partial [Salmonella enterica]|uniref:hypothetical protein n=1 Tax=Salmonella enterica TaxID=28901 RepID=UPI00193E4736
KRAYCLKTQPATGELTRNLIYSTKPFITCDTPRFLSFSPPKKTIEHIHQIITTPYCHCQNIFTVNGCKNKTKTIANIIPVGNDIITIPYIIILFSSLIS